MPTVLINIHSLLEHLLASFIRKEVYMISVKDTIV